MGERELPEGWEWKRLGEAADINMGQSPSGTSYNENGNGTPFLQGNAEFGDNFPKHKKFTTEPSKIASKGSVLISVRAPVGDTNIADLNYCIGRGLASISLKNGDNKYLLYLLRSMKPMIEAKGTGSTFKAISKSIIHEIKIPLPPLPVQRQIVAVLEQSEAVKQKRQEADALTGALLQTVFREMFGDPVTNEMGWEVAPLGKICSEIYRYPTFYGFKYSENGVPVVRIANILFSGGMNSDLEKYVFIKKEISQKFPRTIIEYNDILMAVRGDGSTVKRIGIVDTPILIGANMSPNLIRIKADQNILSPHYLFHLMTSEMGQKLLEKYVSRTAKKTITGENIKQISIPLPPLALQQQFARIVEDVERIRERQVASGKAIEGLCEGLMQRAFSGQLA